MGFFAGILYNLKGLRLGIKTPRLMILGLARLAAVVAATVLCAGAILFYHGEILELLWSRPQSPWVLPLWVTASWLLALVLVALSSVLAYLLAQVLFAVVIMDAMARITEQTVRGDTLSGRKMPFLRQLAFLAGQEIPRSVIPVLLTLFAMAIGWLTPLGPVMTVASPLVAAVFLAWDNTDLIPARQQLSFRRRFRFLLNSLPFHLGFGLWFLVPVANILFLSFAPVGATLYYLDGPGARQGAGKAVPAAPDGPPGAPNPKTRS